MPLNNKLWLIVLIPILILVLVIASRQQKRSGQAPPSSTTEPMTSQPTTTLAPLTELPFPTDHSLVEYVDKSRLGHITYFFLGTVKQIQNVPDGKVIVIDSDSRLPVMKVLSKTEVSRLVQEKPRKAVPATINDLKVGSRIDFPMGYDFQTKQWVTYVTNLTIIP